MIVVLISGRGSNMRALLDARAAGQRRDQQPRRRRRTGAGVRARRRDRAWSSIAGYATREAFDAALAAEIERFQPRLVALAGFMRILTPGFVARYRERMLNIHPSLLPAFPGLRYARAGARRGRQGAWLHGAFRDRRARPRADRVAGGGAGARRTTTPRALAARVLEQEHVIYPRAVRWFLEGRLVVRNGVVHMKGERCAAGRCCSTSLALSATAGARKPRCRRASRSNTS